MINRAWRFDNFWEYTNRTNKHNINYVSTLKIGLARCDNSVSFIF